MIILSFADDSVEFQCRYARTVTATSDITIIPVPNRFFNTGDLTYNMVINAGSLGGNTDVTITPNHNLAGITPRYLLSG